MRLVFLVHFNYIVIQFHPAALYILSIYINFKCVSLIQTPSQKQVMKTVMKCAGLILTHFAFTMF